MGGNALVLSTFAASIHLTSTHSVLPCTTLFHIIPTHLRQRLEEERARWERQLQTEAEARRAALEEAHAQRLWSLRQEYSDRERMHEEQLMAAMDERMRRRQAEAAAAHEARLTALVEQHQAALADAHAALAAAAAPSAGAADGVRESAAAAAREAAEADVSALRRRLAEEQRARIETEVTEEGERYRASARAELLQRLGGELDGAVADAAARLEERRRELDALEAVVADKAFLLQELEGRIAAARAAGDASDGALGADAQQRAREREQQQRQQEAELGELRQQVRAEQAALETADAALVERRARAAEAQASADAAEVSAAAVKRQLAELEAGAAAAAAEQQARAAEMAFLRRRLESLKEDCGRRQVGQSFLGRGWACRKAQVVGWLCVCVLLTKH